MGSTKRRRRRRSQIPSSATPASTKSGWRQTIDSWGGFPVLVPIAIALVVVIVIVARTPLGFSSSEDPLLGDAVAITSTAHVAVGSLGPNPPLTPAGGAMYATPLRQGTYDDQVADGFAIHALEHGMVWITYQLDQLSAADFDVLESVASDFGRDTILSPRVENGSPIVIVSWGRRLVMDDLDEQLVRDFVTTNRNRSPEPGIR